MMRSKSRIEQLGQEIVKKDQQQQDKDENFEQLLQLGFDVFQYICVKISADSNID